MPVFNEAVAIVGFLERLRPWREVAEIIVVDGGSNDETAQLASPLCDQVLISGAGRACQMNQGAARATGDYLMFLHCDTQLLASPGSFIDRLAAAPPWGFFNVRLSGGDYRLRIIEWAMNMRSGISRVATGDQGIFLARSLWLAQGGYADIPLMEDVELCKRLRQIAVPAIVRPGVITSSRRWEQCGVWMTVLNMWSLRLAYWLGVSPQRLARRYHG